MFRRRAIRAVAISLVAPVVAGSVAGLAIAAIYNF